MLCYNNPLQSIGCSSICSQLHGLVVLWWIWISAVNSIVHAVTWHIIIETASVSGVKKFVVKTMNFEEHLNFVFSLICIDVISIYIVVSDDCILLFFVCALGILGDFKIIVRAFCSFSWKYRKHLLHN